MFFGAEHFAYILAAGFALLHPAFIAGLFLFGKEFNGCQFSTAKMQVHHHAAPRQQDEA